MLPKPTRILAILLLLAGPCLAQSEGQEQDSGSFAGTAFHVEKVNPELPQAETPPNLATPQACVEHFVLACRDEQWLSAGRALNLRLVEDVDADKAGQLARKLHYLLNQNLWIDWSLLPDRPDATRSDGMLNNQSPLAGQPRRSIQLGKIGHNGRDVAIRVERVKPSDGPPLWLFAAQTVANIDPLYEARGPSWLARQAPEWSRTRLLWRVPLWQWLALMGLLITAAMVAWLVVHIISRNLTHHLPGRGADLARTIRWPAALFAAGIISYLAVGSILTLPGHVSAFGSPLVFAIVVLSTTWIAIRVMAFVSEQFTRSRRQEDLTIDESGTLARLTIFRYGLILLIVAIGLSVLLISMDLFRTVGLALLGSAGAAAVILGLAGHTILGNLLAGVQIAIARPFRIGDTVIVEGYWGRVEELRYTYVAVRTWDEKRLILPIRYFLDHWFENWSKTDQYLIKPIYLKVDYRTDVPTVRDKFLELVKEDEAWAEDRDEPEVLVTECGDETMTVRLTCGGPDPSSAWKLSCRVREKLVAWLQQYQDGEYLPRRRVILHEGQQDQADAEERDGGRNDQGRTQPQPTTSGDDEGDAQD